MMESLSEFCEPRSERKSLNLAPTTSKSKKKRRRRREKKRENCRKEEESTTTTTTTTNQINLNLSRTNSTNVANNLLTQNDHLLMLMRSLLIISILAGSQLIQLNLATSNINSVWLAKEPEQQEKYPLVVGLSKSTALTKIPDDDDSKENYSLKSTGSSQLSRANSESEGEKKFVKQRTNSIQIPSIKSSSPPPPLQADSSSLQPAIVALDTTNGEDRQQQQLNNEQNNQLRRSDFPTTNNPLHSSSSSSFSPHPDTPTSILINPAGSPSEHSSEQQNLINQIINRSGQEATGGLDQHQPQNYQVLFDEDQFNRGNQLGAFLKAMSQQTADNNQSLDLRANNKEQFHQLTTPPFNTILVNAAADENTTNNQFYNNNNNNNNSSSQVTKNHSPDSSFWISNQEGGAAEYANISNKRFEQPAVYFVSGADTKWSGFDQQQPVNTEQQQHKPRRQLHNSGTQYALGEQQRATAHLEQQQLLRHQIAAAADLEQHNIGGQQAAPHIVGGQANVQTTTTTHETSRRSQPKEPPLESNTLELVAGGEEKLYSPTVAVQPPLSAPSTSPTIDDLQGPAYDIELAPVLSKLKQPPGQFLQETGSAKKHPPTRQLDQYDFYTKPATPLFGTYPRNRQQQQDESRRNFYSPLVTPPTASLVQIKPNSQVSHLSPPHTIIKQRVLSHPQQTYLNSMAQQQAQLKLQQAGTILPTNYYPDQGTHHQNTQTGSQRFTQQQQQRNGGRQNKRSLLASLSNRLNNWVDLSRDNHNFEHSFYSTAGSRHQQQYPAVFEHLNRRMRTGSSNGHQYHLNNGRDQRFASASDRYYSRSPADWPASSYYYAHNRPVSRNYHSYLSMHDQLHPFVEQPTVAPAPNSLERFYGYSPPTAHLNPYHPNGYSGLPRPHHQRRRHHRTPANPDARHHRLQPTAYGPNSAAGKKLLAGSEPQPASFIPVVAVSVTKTSPAPKSAPPQGVYLDDSQQQHHSQPTDSSSANEIDEYLNSRLGNKQIRDRERESGQSAGAGYQSRDSAPRQTISGQRNHFNPTGDSLTPTSGDSHTTTVKSAVFGYLPSVEAAANPLLGAFGILGPQFGSPISSGGQSSSAGNQLTRAHNSLAHTPPTHHHALTSVPRDTYAHPHEHQLGADFDDRYRQHPLVDSAQGESSESSQSSGERIHRHHHHHHHLDVGAFVAPEEQQPSLSLQLQANNFAQNDIAHPFFQENSHPPLSTVGSSRSSQAHSAAHPLTPIEVYPANQFHSIQLLKPDHHHPASIAAGLLNPLLAADGSYKNTHYMNAAASGESGAQQQFMPATILFHPAAVAAAAAHQQQQAAAAAVMSQIGPPPPMRASGMEPQESVNHHHHQTSSSSDQDESSSSHNQHVQGTAGSQLNTKGKKRSDFFANAGQILLSALPLLLAPTLGLMFASSPANPAARFQGSSFSQASGGSSSQPASSSGSGAGTVQHSMPSNYINSLAEGVVSKASSTPQLFTPTPPGYLLTTTTISSKPTKSGNSSSHNNNNNNRSASSTPSPNSLTGRSRSSSSTTSSPKMTVTLTTISSPPLNESSQQTSGTGTTPHQNSSLKNSYEHLAPPGGQHTIVLVTQEAESDNQLHRTHYDVGGYEGVDFDAQYASLRRPPTNQSTPGNSNKHPNKTQSGSPQTMHHYNPEQQQTYRPLPNHALGSGSGGVASVNKQEKNKYQYAAVTAATALQVNGASHDGDLDSVPASGGEYLAASNEEENEKSGSTKLYPVSTWPPLRRRTVSLVTSNGNKTLPDSSHKYSDLLGVVGGNLPGSSPESLNISTSTPVNGQRAGPSQPASILKVNSAGSVTPQVTKFDDDDEDTESYERPAIRTNSTTFFGTDKSSSRKRLTRNDPPPKQKSSDNRTESASNKMISLSRRRRSADLDQQLESPPAIRGNITRTGTGKRAKKKIRIKKSKRGRSSTTTTTTTTPPSNEQVSMEDQQVNNQSVWNSTESGGAGLERSASFNLNSIDPNGTMRASDDLQKRWDPQEQLKGDSSKSKSAHIITTMITHLSDEDAELGVPIRTHTATPLEAFDYYLPENNRSSEIESQNYYVNRAAPTDSEWLERRVRKKHLSNNKLAAFNQNNLYNDSLPPNNPFDKLAQRQHLAMQNAGDQSGNLFSSGGRGRFPIATTPMEVTTSKYHSFRNGSSADSGNRDDGQLLASGGGGGGGRYEGSKGNASTGLVLNDETRRALENYGHVIFKDTSSGNKWHKSEGQKQLRRQQLNTDMENSVEPSATERTTYTSNRGANFIHPPSSQSELDGIDPLGVTHRPLEPGEWLRNRLETSSQYNSATPLNQLRGERSDISNSPASSGHQDNNNNYHSSRHLAADYIDNPANRRAPSQQQLHYHQQQSQHPHQHQQIHQQQSFNQRPAHHYPTQRDQLPGEQLGGSGNYESAYSNMNRAGPSGFVRDRANLIENEQTGGGGLNYGLSMDERIPMNSEQYHYAHSSSSSSLDKYPRQHLPDSGQHTQMNGGHENGGQFKFNPTSSLNGYNLYTTDHTNPSSPNRHTDTPPNSTNYPTTPTHFDPTSKYSSGYPANNNQTERRLKGPPNELNNEPPPPIPNTNGHYLGPPLHTPPNSNRRDLGPGAGFLYDLMRNSQYNPTGGGNPQTSSGGGSSDIAGSLNYHHTSNNYRPMSQPTTSGGGYYSTGSASHSQHRVPASHSNAYNNNHQHHHHQMSTSFNANNNNNNNQLNDHFAPLSNHYGSNSKPEHHQLSSAELDQPYSRSNGQKYGFASATTPQMNARFSPISQSGEPGDYIPAPVREPIGDPFYPPTKYSTSPRNHGQPTGGGANQQSSVGLPPTAPPPPPQPAQLYQPESSIYSPSNDRGPPQNQLGGPLSSSLGRGNESPVMNEYLKRVQFSDSDRDKLMASYLTCDGLLNDNDHCLERLSCEFSDPQNIEKANKLDRAVSSILLGHILINTYIPNQFKLRLKSASLFGYTQSGKCSRFLCNKLTKPSSSNS